jgi:uncharacterized protein (DUF488 family)
MTTPRVLTIGHSTRTIEDFTALLQAYGVQLIVDIRTVSRSRRNPQFNEDTLAASLKKSGIDYVRLKDLGGLRRPRKDSLNVGWRNPSFRGFADYMQTPEFETGINDLIRLAQDRSVAIMCAEALPWRCHRSLVADALVARGIKVEHIMTLNKLIEHSITKWAKVDGKQITYPEIPAQTLESASLVPVGKAQVRSQKGPLRRKRMGQRERCNQGA